MDAQITPNLAQILMVSTSSIQRTKSPNEAHHCHPARSFCEASKSQDVDQEPRHVEARRLFSKSKRKETYHGERTYGITLLSYGLVLSPVE